MVSMLKPGAGLAEVEDWEKPRAQNSNTRGTTREKRMNRGLLEDAENCKPMNCRSATIEAARRVYNRNSENSSKVGIRMTSSNGSNGNGYVVPKPRAEWI